MATFLGTPKNWAKCPEFFGYDAVAGFLSFFLSSCCNKHYFLGALDERIPTIVDSGRLGHVQRAVFGASAIRASEGYFPRLQIHSKR